jgi:hypothetical protein
MNFIITAKYNQHITMAAIITPENLNYNSEKKICFLFLLLDPKLGSTTVKN